MLGQSNQPTNAVSTTQTPSPASAVAAGAGESASTVTPATLQHGWERWTDGTSSSLASSNVTVPGPGSCML